MKTSKSVDKGALQLFSQQKQYHFVGRTSANNGVQGFLDALDFPANPKHTFSVIQIWENVAQFRDRDWYASQNIFVLTPLDPKVISCKHFFIASINTALRIFWGGYSSYPTLKSLKELKIFLPTQNGEIDFDFMENFIRAIEKLVIKDLVIWNEQKMKTYKEVVFEW